MKGRTLTNVNGEADDEVSIVPGRTRDKIYARCPGQRDLRRVTDQGGRGVREPATCVSILRHWPRGSYPTIFGVRPIPLSLGTLITALRSNWQTHQQVRMLGQSFGVFPQLCMRVRQGSREQET